MAANGRPTPQFESRFEGERPRFKDRVPGADKRPEVNPFFADHRSFGEELLSADQAWRLRGVWKDAFHREAPLHVELGSGNGFFLTGLASQHPEWNVLGVEIRYKRVVICAKKLRKSGLSHVKIARYHAAYLDDLFEPGSLDGLYVNHPDPWPKTRHEKNRLISRWFLEDVVSLLKPGARFRLKSDHLPNIERAADLIDHDPDGNPIERLPLSITGRSDDVTGGVAPWGDDIETNYQKKFRLKGEPVYALELTRT